MAAYTPALFPKSMLAILPGAAENADDFTLRIWENLIEYFVGEFSGMKVLAVGTVAGILFVGTGDVSTMEGFKGAKPEISLEGRKCIMGEQFTLAYISWLPHYFVLFG